MRDTYVHGYDERESRRLQDQASTLAELLHSDTSYPAGSRVLEAGCGVGAQTVTLAQNSPGALITAIDISESSLALAREKAEKAGITNVTFQQANMLHLPFEAGSFDHVFVCFVLEHLSSPVDVLVTSRKSLSRAAPSPSSRATTAPRIFIRTARKPVRRYNARSSCRQGPAVMH